MNTIDNTLVVFCMFWYVAVMVGFFCDRYLGKNWLDRYYSFTSNMQANIFIAIWPATILISALVYAWVTEDMKRYSREADRQRRVRFANKD